MAPKKIATNKVVSANDVGPLTIEDLRMQLASINEKYEKQQGLILHLTRSIEVLTKPPNISTEQILQTIDEYFEKKEKEPCLVGINILEKSSDDETAIADRLLAKNIVAVAGI
ncbi:unnamed protein product [Dracunculus medinensis]|uniref:Dynein light chain n=1 Tax=Dracunculus medinensis TaxID=318479 RepID=A0A0N4U1E9_DRAME|nr:unnamed protein product [Dracunculus medinensis]